MRYHERKPGEAPRTEDFNLGENIIEGSVASRERNTE